MRRSVKQLPPSRPAEILINLQVRVTSGILVRCLHKLQFGTEREKCHARKAVEQSPALNFCGRTRQFCPVLDAEHGGISSVSPKLFAPSLERGHLWHPGC
jgi:hypothetical protein